MLGPQAAALYVICKQTSPKPVIPNVRSPATWSGAQASAASWVRAAASSAFFASPTIG
jgi:hypothetical protein